MARQPPCLVRGSQAGLPPALAYAGKTLARLERALHGYINGRGSGEGRISELNEAARKLSDFRTFVMAGAFRRPKAL
jgi:hypothetical protein